jgi:hypothetical protein
MMNGMSSQEVAVSTTQTLRTRQSGFFNACY